MPPRTLLSTANAAAKQLSKQTSLAGSAGAAASSSPVLLSAALSASATASAPVIAPVAAPIQIPKVPSISATLAQIKATQGQKGAAETVISGLGGGSSGAGSNANSSSSSSSNSNSSNSSDSSDGPKTERMTLKFFLTDGLLRAALTSGILYGLGDAMAQLIVEPWVAEKRKEALKAKGLAVPEEAVEESQSLDVRRTANFAVAGALFHGPYFSRIYLVLDRVWPHLSSKASIPRRLLLGLKKSLSTNFFFGPPFLFGFLAFVSALEGLSWDEIKTKISRLGPILFFDGLKAWPLASALNFAFTPPQYRLAVVNVIGAFWNSYVSFRNATNLDHLIVGKEDEEREELEAATMLGAEMLAMRQLDAVAAHHEKVNKNKKEKGQESK